jgi:hypothetical protein
MALNVEGSAIDYGHSITFLTDLSSHFAAASSFRFPFVAFTTSW